jgi:alkanesulfonate monooxygenase SsuD/methylene tetrahydromethanopterin reductase-like flavin-dependent oxidoreductase (luciferase family)
MSNKQENIDREDCDIMKVSITIDTTFGVNWTIWKQLVPQLENAGFATIFRGDHFSLGSPPNTDALELITSLTYLAEHTRRVDFGSLVAPVSFRDPVMLARQAMSIDDLSGGRMILGVGAGWAEWEHTQFGYNLGDTKTRMDRFEEGLEVITRLVRSKDPVSFQGRFFRLQDARLLPRPHKPTPILIGGNGPKRTLPLVAQYADIWNCEIETPERFRQLSDQLDDFIRARGRSPSDVKRTAYNHVLCFHTPEELRDALNFVRIYPFLTGASDEDILAFLASMHGIVGKPDEVIRKMQAYAEAGVEEFVIGWPFIDHLDGLQAIINEILPNFAASS